MCIDVRYGNMYVHVIQINARLTYMRIYIYIHSTLYIHMQYEYSCHSWNKTQVGLETWFYLAWVMPSTRENPTLYRSLISGGGHGLQIRGHNGCVCTLSSIGTPRTVRRNQLAQWLHKRSKRNLHTTYILGKRYHRVCLDFRLEDLKLVGVFFLNLWVYTVVCDNFSRTRSKVSLLQLFCASQGEVRMSAASCGVHPLVGWTWPSRPSSIYAECLGWLEPQAYRTFLLVAGARSCCRICGNEESHFAWTSQRWRHGTAATAAVQERRPKQLCGLVGARPKAARQSCSAGQDSQGQCSPPSGKPGWCFLHSRLGTHRGPCDSGSKGAFFVGIASGCTALLTGNHEAVVKDCMRESAG